MKPIFPGIRCVQPIRLHDCDNRLHRIHSAQPALRFRLTRAEHVVASRDRVELMGAIPSARPDRNGARDAGLTATFHGGQSSCPVIDYTIGLDQNISGDLQSHGEAADHAQGQRAAPCHHLGDPRPAADERL